MEKKLIVLKYIQRLHNEASSFVFVLFWGLYKYCLWMAEACLENTFDNLKPQKVILGKITARYYLLVDIDT